jgi:hypothetical protein
MDEFALRIRAVLETPVAVGDRLVPVAVRIGTATRTGRGADAAAVVREAERAVPAVAPPASREAAEAAAARPGGRARTVTDRRRDGRSGSGPIDR